MRPMLVVAGAFFALMNTSCGGGGTTEREIVNSLQDQLRSVSGDWTGLVNAPNGIRFEFKLQQASNGQVSGTGTMKEDNAAAAVPITVSGTFAQPNLTLVFDGMVYESRQVKGAAQGSYTTVGGVGSTLILTAPNYSRELPILLQEKP